MSRSRQRDGWRSSPTCTNVAALRAVLRELMETDADRLVSLGDLTWGVQPEETRERYSPGNFVTVEKSVGSGNPDLERAWTSHVGRKNGSLRQWCRRLTRLTYAFSKKKENLPATLALHSWYYNFARIHSRLRVTPAMESGLTNHVWTNHVWTIEELLFVG